MPRFWITCPSVLPVENQRDFPQKSKEDVVDVYQKRYLEHQARKKAQITQAQGSEPEPIGELGLLQIQGRRVSQRLFNSKPLPPEVVGRILSGALTAPSSCNRRAVKVKIVEDKATKEFLSGVLVGGVGWIHRAHTILLLAADMDAYKSPGERDFMPYLDAGFMAQNMWLIAESQDVGCVYVNPNIRSENIHLFYERLNLKPGMRFCGALALGYYDIRCLPSDKPSIEDLLL
jgi:nitroreductase